MAQFSKSSVLHCPHKDCGKILLTQMAIWEGTTFVMKCPHCSGYVKIQATFNIIIKKALTDPRERSIIEKEDEK